MVAFNPELDPFFETATQWKAELSALRPILCATDLVEERKWKQPCYTFEGKNVAILGAFKAYCALSFFKGALLKDPEKLLVAPGENSQASRLFKFTSTQQIIELAPTIRAYLEAAIQIERSGQTIEFKKSVGEIPEELITLYAMHPGLQEAFEKLTPGRQRGYLLHFNQAKQSATRTARIEKFLTKILAGKGMRDCTCGLSKRMPTCDGSHKQLEATTAN